MQSSRLAAATARSRSRPCHGQQHACKQENPPTPTTSKHEKLSAFTSGLFVFIVMSIVIASTVPLCLVQEGPRRGDTR
jgi:hypothetical protein